MSRRRALAVVVVLAAIAPACVQGTDVRPDCRGEDPVFVLAAQAVPSATLLPCLDALLTGWQFEGSQIVDGAFRFWLGSDRAGLRSVQVELAAECDIARAVEVVPSPDEAGTRRFEEPLSLSPAFAADRYYRFPGGCVTVEYRFSGADAALVLQADQAISFRPRQPLVDRWQGLGLVLCGAGAPACPGGD
ncbi:MAG: hypothetical protein ACXWX6_00745 [Actinomycetota bacterium]